MSFHKIAALALTAFDNYKGRNSLWTKNYLEQTQWFKQSEIERLKLKRLRALLLHSYENVPYYHELFKAVGFRPGDMKSVKDLSKIHVLRKQNLRSQSARLVSTKLSRSQFISRTTGGTTAAPVSFYRSKVDVSWRIGAELRGYSWAGYHIGDKQVSIWNFPRERTKTLTFKLKRVNECSSCQRKRALMSESHDKKRALLKPRDLSFLA